jgi:HAD superfamily hydrolase (TIGR01509 family)
LSREEGVSIPGGTLEDQLANYVPLSAVPKAVDRYHKYFTRHFNTGIRVFPGIRELLFTLHRKGVKLAVCTGADKRTANCTLAQSGLSQFFAAVVTGDDVSAPKPDPEGLTVAMNAIGANADETVYVGDHPNDIQASRDVGAKTAAAFWGSMHRNKLEDLKPDFLFRHPSEALRLSSFQLSHINLGQKSQAVHLYMHRRI